MHGFTSGMVTYELSLRHGWASLLRKRPLNEYPNTTGTTQRPLFHQAHGLLQISAHEQSVEFPPHGDG